MGEQCYSLLMTRSSNEFEQSGQEGAFHPALKLDNETIEQPAEPKPLSPGNLARIHFETFRFAQGSPELQQYITRYVHLAEGDRITSEALEQSFVPAENRMTSFITHGEDKTHTASAIEKSIGGMSREMKRIRECWEGAQDDEPGDMPWILENAVSGSIGSDHLFIIQRGGRPRAKRDETEQAQPAAKYLSQFVYYGLNHHSTGVPEFDKMFADMVDTLNTDDYLRSNVDQQLREVIATHVSHYPEELELLPEQWRPLPDASLATGAVSQGDSNDTRADSARATIAAIQDRQTSEVTNQIPAEAADSSVPTQAKDSKTSASWRRRLNVFRSRRN